MPTIQGPMATPFPLHHAVTASRYCLVVVFFILFYWEPVARAFLVATVVAIQATDVVDGWVARKLKSAQLSGSVFDSMADFVADLTIYLCLLSVGVVSLWLVVTVFWTWSLMSSIRMLGLVSGNGYARPRGSGKVRGVVNGLGMVCLVGAYSMPGSSAMHFQTPIGLGVVCIVAVAHIVAGLDFLSAYGHTVFRSRPQPADSDRASSEHAD